MYTLLDRIPLADGWTFLTDESGEPYLESPEGDVGIVGYGAPPCQAWFDQLNAFLGEHSGRRDGPAPPLVRAARQAVFRWLKPEDLELG